MPKEATDPFDLSNPAPEVAPLEGSLQPKPRATVWLSKKVLLVLFGGAALGLLIFVASVGNYDAKKPAPSVEEEKSTAETKALPSGLPSDLKSDKKGAVAAPTENPPTEDKQTPPMPAGVPAMGDKSNTSVLGPGGKGGPLPPGAALPQQGTPQQNVAQSSNLTPEQQRLMVARQEREDRLRQARLGGLEARAYQDGGSGGTGASGVMTAASGNAKATGSGQMGLFSASQGAGVQVASDQDQKLKFLKDGGNAPAGYHPNTVLPPMSPYQLNAGSKIPSMLEMGVNSDLPGMVTARVRQNVYASVMDSCLLIPSTSLLVGSYDSRVAIGQARQLVVWNRVIFPNGYELNLAGMPSADAGGQAGLDADVDNHWLRLFGVALGMTAVTAGVQMSVTQSTTNSSSGVVSQPSNAQTISNALAQQFGQLGGQMMGKYLNVQPTLRNYFGERFNIIVPRSIVFPSCYRR